MIAVGFSPGGGLRNPWLARLGPRTRIWHGDGVESVGGMFSPAIQRVSGRILLAGAASGGCYSVAIALPGLGG